MEKIYLVMATMTNEEGEELNTYVSSVFTNKKLAKTCCDYRNLKNVHDRKNGTRSYKINYKIEEVFITNVNYEEELKREQMKELPF